MISNGDFISRLISIIGDLLPVCLLSCCHDVKSVTELYSNLFICRRVINAILTNKLEAPLIVALRRSRDALGQWHAEIILFPVFYLNIDANFLLDRVSHLGIIVSLASAYEPLFDRNIARI